MTYVTLDWLPVPDHYMIVSEEKGKVVINIIDTHHTCTDPYTKHEQQKCENLMTSLAKRVRPKGHDDL